MQEGQQHGMDESVDSTVNKETKELNEECKSTKESSVQTDLKEDKTLEQNKVVLEPVINKGSAESKTSKNEIWMFASIIFLIALVVSVFTGGFGFGDSGVNPAVVGAMAVNYINDNLLPQDVQAALISAQAEEEIYTLRLEVAGSEITSYVSRDGKYLFPQGFDLTKEVVESTPSNVNITLKESESIKGDANAPVTIIEYSDFQCPYCAKFALETMPKIFEEYVDAGKVKFAFRQFPLAGHPYSQKAAEATLCARDQNKFWEMHDALFENHAGLNDAALDRIVAQLELDKVLFDECIESGKHTSEILDDLRQAQTDGVSGTPAFFINGKLLEGAYPYESFAEIIEQELS